VATQLSTICEGTFQEQVLDEREGVDAMGKFSDRCKSNSSWVLHSGASSSVSVSGCETIGGLELDINGLGGALVKFGLKGSIKVS